MKYLVRLFVSLLALLAIVALFAAYHIMDPRLSPWQPRVTYAFLILTFLCLIASLYLPGRVSRRALGVSFLLAMVLVLGQEGMHYWHKRWFLEQDRKQVQDLNSHFIVGYRDVNELVPMVEMGVGGIFVTKRNARGKTVDQLREEIARLQALRSAKGLPPLIVATDQEGGIVSRLSPPLEKLPPLSSLASAADAESEAQTYGRRQGAALADLGVTVNFSPVVDLKIRHPKNPLDLHSLISRRAISADPEQVTRVALGYIRGLEETGVRATLKHFPGLGRVFDDTHHFSATLDTPLTTLRASDWLPYRRIIQQTGAMIMLAHVVLPEVDPDHPASFSRALVQEVIRGDWRYQGVLISDDMTMAAAYDRGLCDATVGALNAGVDLVLLAFDYEKFYDAVHCAAVARDEGRLAPEALKQSGKRVDRYFRRSP